MPSPRLHVETIAFRGNEVNALPLLVRQTEVSGPEWTRDGTRLPAALVVPQGDAHIVIGATFSSEELAGQTAIVSASRLDGAGHVLQDVAATPVTFNTLGHSERVEFQVAVSHPHIELEIARWQWKVQDVSEAHDATITEHQIAIVLGFPRPPWSSLTPALVDTSLPWWEVLVRACAAAGGAPTLDDAAARITETVFNVWGGRYYRWNSGAETFASDAGESHLAFDCSRFLSLLDAIPPPAREIVDCSDIATIVSSFAAILGCPIEQLTLFRGLNCEVLKLVGHDAWRFGLGFPLHEVGVSVLSAADPQVWDGCLMLSGDATRGPGIPTTGLLPTGLGGSEYLTRLLSTNGMSFADHILRGPLTRPIRPLSNQVATPASDEHLQALAALYGIDEWPTPVQRMVRAFDPLTMAGGGWTMRVETAFPPLESIEPDVDAVARVAIAFATDPARHVRMTIYVSADADAARCRLLYLLGHFQPPMTPLDVRSEIAFISDDRRTIVGSIMNVTYKVIDGGESPAAAATDAPLWKATLTDRLHSLSQPL
jgi:hypothetical protein